MADAFICDAIRTPVGRFGGALSSVRADDLAAIPIKALMERNSDVDWSRVDDLYMGCANQAGEDNRNVARMAGLLAGLPDAVPGCTVNRLCGSGLEAVIQASRAIRLGDHDVVIAGGVESMSRAPYSMEKPAEAFPRRIKSTIQPSGRPSGKTASQQRSIFPRSFGQPPLPPGRPRCRLS